MEETGAFWRSVFLFFFKWMGIGVLPLLVILGILKLVIHTQPSSPTVALNTSPSASPIESPTPSVTSTVTESPSPIVSPSSSPTPKLQIQVLNGTNRNGVANQVADKLKAAKYVVVSTAQAAKKYDKSTVFYQPGFADSARKIAQIVGASVIQTAPSNLDPKIEVTVVVGNDYK